MPYELSKINDAIRSDPKGFARECDEAFHQKVIAAAEQIASHRGKSHIILLSGPSGSGKTTTAMKVEERLDNTGVETHTVSMDNYFKTIDPETAPRNREGDIDYESPFCLDVDLLKAMHHGSQTSNSFNLLMRVKPELAVSTGFAPVVRSVRDVYSQVGATLLSDRDCGYIHVYSLGEDLQYEIGGLQ